MLAQKHQDFLKYSTRLGNKAMGGNRLGNKFSIINKNPSQIMREHDGGSNPVRVVGHDTSDIGFNPDKKSSNLERGRHLMNNLTRGV